MNTNVLLRLFTAIVCVCVLLCAAEDSDGEDPGHSEPKPEQVHISLGALPHEIVVTWHTVGRPVSDLHNAQVQYGTKKNDQHEFHSLSEVEYFAVDKLFTYRALMSSLKSDTTYYYKVGSPKSSWSKVFQFKTLKAGVDWLPKLIIYGDLGWQNQESLPHLENEMQNNHIDVIYHIGDLAYDLHDLHGEKGNVFMRSMENLVAQLPYMVLPGNHERADNFTHYDARFSMLNPHVDPKASLMNRLNNHYHSQQIGPAHIISISTEFYYYTKWGWPQVKHQFEWLEMELKKAVANRKQRPWIIVLGHRPLYCLRSGDKESCNPVKAERKAIRSGTYYKGNKTGNVVYGLEKLFFDNGVDLQIYGHEHYYCRLYPIFDHQTYNRSTDEETYTDAQAPIHITTGAAGNRELHPAFNRKLNLEIAPVRILDYGYGKLVFKDRLHMVWQETSIDEGNRVIDEIHIKKTQDVPAWKRQ